MPDDAETGKLLKTATMTTVEPEVIGLASGQSSTETRIQLRPITLGRTGRARSGTAGIPEITVSGKGISTDQYADRQTNRITVRNRTAERTSDSEEVERVSTAQHGKQSTWIDLTDSGTLSGKGDTERFSGRNNVDWYAFQDDQLRTTIKVGRKTRRLRD